MASIPQQPPRNNISHPVNRKITKEEPALSGKHIRRGIPPWLAQCAPGRCGYRLRIQWRGHPTPASPGGRWEQLLEFSDSRKCLALLRAIQKSPDHVLEGIQVEGIARARWDPVDVEYLIWRASQREKREAAKGGPR
jgi:hypothetical protein